LRDFSRKVFPENNDKNNMGRLALLCGAVLSLALSAGAQDPQTPDITSQNVDSLSLEALMNMQVTSVSKGQQKLLQTAAAIFVITQGDIQRSGATNIPRSAAYGARIGTSGRSTPAPGRLAPGVTTGVSAMNCW
jgi:hypothetical protein